MMTISAPPGQQQAKKFFQQISFGETMPDNAQHIENIVTAIIDSGKLRQEDWEEFSLVLGFGSDGVNDTSGYSYNAGGKWAAFSVRPSLIAEPANAYREWLRQDGDKPLIKMLFQFNRANNGFNADFEYENEARWQVTPKNLDAMIEQLRPQLNR